MPLDPPAPLARTAPTVSARSFSDPSFSAGSFRCRRFDTRPSQLFSQAASYLTGILGSAVTIFTWGMALHIAFAAVSSEASLQATITQYATVLQWLTAA